MKKRKVGLIVNPVAGMGGSVGLKGTDGEMHEKALELGAEPVTPGRTRDTLAHLEREDEIDFLAAPGRMGATYLEEMDVPATVIGEIGEETSAEDTKRIAQAMMDRGVELLIFVGGDGTARDITDAVGTSVPVVGVPAGVKVFSAAFALSARAAADMVDAFIAGTSVTEEEVLDIDEEAFRDDRLASRLYGTLLVPEVRTSLQPAKAASNVSAPSEQVKEDIASYIVDMIAFGPVPSRRLGRSLGINNIPPKVCTYSCVYCQLGRTIKMQVERRPFYEPEDLLRDVQAKVEEAKEAGETIDYLSFVPDGEPTLDANLGHEIELLRPLGIEIAVISNSSLIWREDVREELGQADWVSLKADAASEEVWRQVNRPHGRLQLRAIQDGMLAFAEEYDGVLATETMLVDGANDGHDAVKEVAAFLARLKPDRAYVAIPTRPPAEPWAHAPDEAKINRAYQIISEQVDQVEYLIGYEGNAFASTGDVEEDLLSITAVHPMREHAIQKLLEGRDADWAVVRRLVAEDELVEAEYDGHRYYVRRLNRYREDRG